MKKNHNMLNTIYTSDELDILMDSIENYTSRVNFIKRYINNLIYENKLNGNYKLFSTGLIKNPNDEILVNIITGSTTFFTFPLRERDNGDHTYIVSSLENCKDFRDIMNKMLLYI